MRQLFVDVVEWTLSSVHNHYFWWFVGQPVAMLITFTMLRIMYYSILSGIPSRKIVPLFWTLQLFKYLLILSVVFSLVLLIFTICVFSMSEFD
jgi:hypothetical protein